MGPDGFIMALWFIALAAATMMLVRSRVWRARQAVGKVPRLVDLPIEERLCHLERIVSGEGSDAAPRMKAPTHSSSPAAASRADGTD
jgi:hypothetical protein